MAWPLSAMMSADQVAALLNEVEADCANRVDFTSSIDRDAAEAAIHAILWAYGSRPSDTASCYAWMNLWAALHVDVTSLKFLPSEPTPTPESI